MTRRTALRLIGGSAVATALAAVGGLTKVFAMMALPDATTAEPAPVFPIGGAGLFDVDPDQGGVSQSPSVAVTGDIASLPLDMGV